MIESRKGLEQVQPSRPRVLASSRPRVLASSRPRDFATLRLCDFALEFIPIVILVDSLFRG